ncbi:MAG: helix-turn-helix domain-containing protein [Deltaproteobacteria bacterium]|nr:helix-turn-helix domain-containing protein [Deltaproteobacteria bacterium]
MESPGSYLKREREIRGITLEDISNITKINLRMLRALEEDDINTLPAPTFVKGFIRAYCKYVGLDGEDAVLRYEQFLKTREEETQAGSKKDVPSKNKPSLITIAIAFLTLILTSGIYIVFSNKGAERLSEDNSVESRAVEPAGAKNGSEARLADTREVFTQEVELHPSITEGDVKDKTVELSLLARRITWVQVTVDNGKTFDALLREGEKASWEAKEGFVLVVGNAGGVDVTFDGKPLGKLGEEGQVVRLKLP